MTSGLRRCFTLIAAGLAGWVIGYVMADARVFNASNDAGHHSSPTRDSVRANTRIRDEEDTTFRNALAQALHEPGPLARRRGFREAISALRSEEMTEALSIIRRLEAQTASDLSEKIYSRWAEINPAEAAQAAASDGEDWSYGAMQAVMDVWSVTAPEEAQQWIVSLHDSNTQLDALHDFLLAIATSDPQRAVRLKRELLSASQLTPALRAKGTGDLDRAVFWAWGSQNGREAMQAALNLQESSAQSMALCGALNGWASRDFRAALRAVANLPSSITVIEYVIGYAYKVDPNEVAAGILELPAGPLRMTALSKAMESLCTRDLALAQRLVADISPGPMAQGIGSTVIFALAASDPEAAATFLAGLSPSQHGENDFLYLGRTWAQSSLAGALEWASQIAVPKNQQAAILGVLKTWADDEPASAATWAIEHLSDENAAEVLRNIYDEWCRSETMVALDWALALPAGKSRDTALGHVIGPLAASDLTRATQLFDELSKDSQYSAAAEIASEWADSDPASAAQWALQLTDESVRGNALGQVMEKWTTDDLSAAEDWVRAMPAGTIRDVSLAHFIAAARGTDPERAAGLLTLIADAEERENTASSIVTNWKRSDKVAALRWLQTTPALPPDARRRLLLEFESRNR
jgi:hypothetical protein